MHAWSVTGNLQRHSATPKIGGRPINLANVDKYIGKITRLQVGTSLKNGVGLGASRRAHPLAQSIRITPANISDSVIQQLSLEAEHLMDQKESTRAGNGLVNSNQPTHGSAGTCSQCGHRDPEAGGRSSGGDNRRSTLRDRGRKDADHEFF